MLCDILPESMSIFCSVIYVVEVYCSITWSAMYTVTHTTGNVQYFFLKITYFRHIQGYRFLQAMLRNKTKSSKFTPTSSLFSTNSSRPCSTHNPQSPLLALIHPLTDSSFSTSSSSSHVISLASAPISIPLIIPSSLLYPQSTSSWKLLQLVKSQNLDRSVFKYVSEPIYYSGSYHK